MMSSISQRPSGKKRPKGTLSQITIFCGKCRNPVSGSFFELVVPDTVLGGTFCNKVCGERWCSENGVDLS
jgi:hypothetical protein